MKRILTFIIILILLSLGIFYFFYSGKDPDIKADISLITLKTLNIIFLISTISIIFIIIRENSNPVLTIAWVQLLVFLPVVGFILYLVFGINHRKKKLFKRKEIVDDNRLKEISGLFVLHQFETNKTHHTQNNPAARMINMLYNNNKAHLTIHNQVEVYANGREQIESLFKDLKKAKQHIHLEYYSIEHGITGKKLRDILLKKAKEGVSIRIIYDAVGSMPIKRSFFESMKKAGIELDEFMPVKMPIISSRLNYRNHRKIVIIDGQIGYIGGINIGDKYMGLDKYFGHWRDTHLRIEGDAVYSLQKAFLVDWNFSNDLKYDKEEFFPAHNIKEELPIQTISSGPDSDWENIMQSYFFAITSALKYLYISTPYLVLDESLLMALKTAALSGVDVRIVLPGKPDHKVVFFGSRSYYKELLKAGIKIYEYNRGFMHAKVLLVDGEFVSIGSANMDIRSFKENFEINSIIYNKEFTAIVEKQFEEDFTDSNEILLEEFNKRKIHEKIIESFSRLLSPVL